MRSQVVATLLIALLAGGAASAGEHDFGLGVIVGEPTGLSGKLWLDRRAAIDGALAWDLSGDDAFHIHGDFLLHAWDLIRVEKGSLPVYYGIGGRIEFEDDDDLFGLRIPLGLEYLFPSRRVDLFIEFVPILDLVPETEVRGNGGAGARFFF
jgi:hypothetical protein